MAPHSSTLAWKTPWTEEPGKLQSIGLQSDMTERLHFTSSFQKGSLKKKEIKKDCQRGSLVISKVKRKEKFFNSEEAQMPEYGKGQFMLP